MKTLHILGITILVLYMFGMTVYSGYTADHNKPDDDSNGLFIASYVICIIQCIIYLGGFIYVITVGVSDTNSKSDSKSDSNGGSGCIPFLLNIYWLVIFFNYNVSEKYDEYALVKTIEFFTLLGIIVLGLFIMCIWGLVYTDDEKQIIPNPGKIDETNNIISTV